MAKLFNPTFCSTFDNGIVKHSDLQGIWSKYPASLRPTLLALMGRFDVCFELENPSDDFGKGRSLVPSHLPETEPTNLWPSSCNPSTNDDGEICRVMDDLQCDSEGTCVSIDCASSQTNEPN